MRLSISCFILCSIFFISSCVPKDEGVTLHVDVAEAQAGSYSFFDYFDQVEIIPLEGACAISNGQYSDPQYLSVSKVGFFILDERSGSLYAFNEAGKNRGEIARRGRAESEFAMAYGIRTDDVKESVTVLDPRGNFYRYSYSGRFLGKEAIDGVVAVHNFCETEAGTLLFSLSDEDHLRLWRDGKCERIDYEPSLPLKHQFNASNPFLSIEGSVHYYEGLTGTVYSIENESCRTRAVYSWDFGRWGVNLKKLEDPGYDFLESLKNEFYDCVYPFLNMFCVGRVLVADVLYHNQEHSLFYDLKNGKSCLISEFEEGVRFKAQVEKDGVFYLLVEADSLSDYVNPNVLDENNLAIYESIRGSQVNPVILKYSGFHPVWR